MISEKQFFLYLLLFERSMKSELSQIEQIMKYYSDSKFRTLVVKVVHRVFLAGFDEGHQVIQPFLIVFSREKNHIC